jgi:hypothetical protein
MLPPAMSAEEAAVSDLLETADDEALAGLPEPRDHALEVALLRTSPSGVAAQGRAVAAGIVSLMRTLARSQPVLFVSVALLELVLDRASDADRP